MQKQAPELIIIHVATQCTVDMVTKDYQYENIYLWLKKNRVESPKTASPLLSFPAAAEKE